MKKGGAPAGYIAWVLYSGSKDYYLAKITRTSTGKQGRKLYHAEWLDGTGKFYGPCTLFYFIHPVTKQKAIL